MSSSDYERLTDQVEAALYEADRESEDTDLRLTHDEVFTRDQSQKATVRESRLFRSGLP